MKIEFEMLRHILRYSDNPEQELKDLCNKTKGLTGGKLEITVEVKV